MTILKSEIKFILTDFTIYAHKAQLTCTCITVPFIAAGSTILTGLTEALIHICKEKEKFESSHSRSFALVLMHP